MVLTKRNEATKMQAYQIINAIDNYKVAVHNNQQDLATALIYALHPYLATYNVTTINQLYQACKQKVKENK